MPTIPRSKAPSYIVLIKDAINSLKERGGCSRETILEYVAAKRGLAHFNGGLVNKYLREGVEKGELVQVKNSFKIARGVAKKKAPAKKAVAPKKKVPAKKAVAPKKKAPAKKAVAPKKKPVATKGR